MNVSVLFHHGIDGWMDVLMKNPITNKDSARKTHKKNIADYSLNCYLLFTSLLLLIPSENKKISLKNRSLTDLE